MSKTYKGQITNDVLELTLQDEAVGGGFGTQTIVWDNTQGVIDQVLGDIPDNWKSAVGDSDLKLLQIGTSCTSIGSYAFYNASFGANKFVNTELIIPDTVTSIGSNAFLYCSFTGSVIIPNSVTSIADRAFLGSNQFDTLVIGNGVTSIADYAFDATIALDTIYLDCPESSWTTNDNALTNTSFINIYVNDAVSKGYTLGSQSFQGGSNSNIQEWNNYPNPIPN